jgi:hypothetical protein
VPLVRTRRMSDEEAFPVTHACEGSAIHRRRVQTNSDGALEATDRPVSVSVFEEDPGIFGSSGCRDDPKAESADGASHAGHRFLIARSDSGAGNLLVRAVLKSVQGHPEH